MSSDKHLHEQAQTPEQGTEPQSEDRRRESRRRFAKAGAATPVIMTLASRSVWGMDCSLSGDILSGNISPTPHQHDCTAGYGCTPGYWKNHPLVWPQCTSYSAGTCVEFKNNGTCGLWDPTTTTGGATAFAAVFGVTSSYGDSMMEVLLNGSGSLDFHAVAAVLSASCTLIDYGATESDIILAYNQALGDSAAMLQLHDVLDAMNNRGCPIDSFGMCENRFVLNEEDVCIPIQ